MVLSLTGTLSIPVWVLRECRLKLRQMEEIAELLRRWQFHARGVKWSEVSRRGGLHPSKLSEFVNGTKTNPTWDTLQKMAAGFGVEPAQFIAGPPTKVAPSIPLEIQTAPPLPASSPSEGDRKGAQAVKPHAGDAPAERTDVPTASDLHHAINELWRAVNAINAVTARAALAESRREDAAPRADRPPRRKGARKSR